MAYTRGIPANHNICACCHEREQMAGSIMCSVCKARAEEMINSLDGNRLGDVVVMGNIDGGWGIRWSL